MQAKKERTRAVNHQALAHCAFAILSILGLSFAAVLPASATTLQRVKSSGRINLGYFENARPFSFKDETGTPDGYAIALCTQIVERLRVELGIPQLAIQWKPITTDSRLSEVQQGNVDLLCAPTNVTIARRQQVSFSIPIFASGNRALLRKDTAVALREAFGETPVTRPVWRGSPAAKVLEKATLAVVSGTTSEKWLHERRAALDIPTTIVSVPNYRAAVQQLLDHKVDVVFGEQSLMLGAMSPAEREKLQIVDRLFTREPAAFALERYDEEFRLLVDQALSQVYASDRFRDLYAKWFGDLSQNERSFFLWNTLQP